MRILDRNVASSIVRAFVASVLLFCFLYILVDLATHLDDFIANKVPVSTVGAYYLSFFPVIFVQTAPVAILLATLFTYSVLNNNNEIIALRASGLDYWQITRPAVILGVIASCLVFVVNERFAPQAAALSQEIRRDKIDTNESRRKEASRPIDRLYFYGLDNRLFYVDRYDPAAQVMTGVTIISQDNNQRMTEKISAARGEWTGSGWKFSGCQISRYDPEDPAGTGETMFFKEKVLDNLRESPNDVLTQRQAVTSMNIRELKAYIKRFKGSGAIAAINDLRVDLNQKIAYPVACIVIVLVGMPFALITGRRKGLTFASTGIAIAIGFSFYVVNAVGLALGKMGALSPVTAAWLAPVLFAAGGFYAARRLF